MNTTILAVGIFTLINIITRNTTVIVILSELL